MFVDRLDILNNIFIVVSVYNCRDQKLLLARDNIDNLLYF